MKPVFCPNSRCDLHDPAHSILQSQWYQHNGYHDTKVVGRVQRYRCKRCRKTFSTRTFHLDYCTKKTISYEEIMNRVSGSESISRIARNLHVLPNSIQNRIDRLSRNCLAMHERLEKDIRLQEDLVADGFESFDRSQYFPNNINILVGNDSQYLYGYTHTTIRRKGRMKKEQREKRGELEKMYRAPRAGIEKSFRMLMRIIPRIWEEQIHPQLILSTDEHPTYPRAIEALPELRDGKERRAFHHHRYSSKKGRTVLNPLFAVNYYDRELRKDTMAFQRETKCFCRNVANGLSRIAVYQAWHNFQKSHRIKTTANPKSVHGVYAGIQEMRIAEELLRLYCERSFLTHLVLREERRILWTKSSVTPLKTKRDYIPSYAWN
jgi:transposase-like protein